MVISFDKKLVVRALILKCVLRRDRPIELETVPIFLQEFGLPRLAAGAEIEEERGFLEGLSAAFGRPDDPVWRQRDEIERAYRRLGRGEISWGLLLRRLHRLRPRHVIAYLKTFGE